MTKSEAVFENKIAPVARTKQMNIVVPILRPADNFVLFLRS